MAAYIYLYSIVFLASVVTLSTCHPLAQTDAAAVKAKEKPIIDEIDPVTGGGKTGAGAGTTSGSGSGTDFTQIFGSGVDRAGERIEKINQGITSILGGVGSGDLGQILRGSFGFSHNENFKKISGSVLDTIFGPRDQEQGDNITNGQKEKKASQ